MIRSIILLYFGCFLGFQVSAQTNNWAPVGATWWYDQIESETWDNITYLRVTSKKDTVVLGQPCRKLVKEHIGMNDTSITGIIYTYEDSGKVYHMTPDGTEFLLWYDFSASVGDTITIFPEAPNLDTLHVKVDSVENAVIGGVPRKRMFLTQIQISNPWSYLFNGPWIEGIGSENHFTPIYAAADPPEGGPIRCYKDDSLGLVQIGSNACDYIYTSISEPDHPEPFPVHILNRQLHYNFTNPTDLQVYDVLGRLVLERRNLSGRHALPLPEFISGFLIVKCRIEGKTVSQAFVIR